MARRGSAGPPRRRTSRADNRPQLLLYVEGTRTEPDYFTHWYRLHRERAIMRIADFHGPPAKLVERAIAGRRQEERDAKRGRGQPYDEVWCVFDVDEHPACNDAIVRALGNDINVAVSNPCIELWFVLHYEDQMAYIDRKAAQRRSKELLRCSKSLSDEALDDLTSRHREASKRARRLDDKHTKDGSPSRSNPSSNVWQLVDRMIDGRD